MADSTVPLNGRGALNGPGLLNGRNETKDERMDRNWNEMLQELRVMQTGVQIIGGFLLTLPFQERFTTLSETERWLFLALVLLAALTTGLMLVPVSLHRRLFQRHVKERLVAAGHVIVKIVLGCVALLIGGCAALIFSVVQGHDAGMVAGVGVLAVLLVLMLIYPYFSWSPKRQADKPDATGSGVGERELGGKEHPGNFDAGP